MANNAKMVAGKLYDFLDKSLGEGSSLTIEAKKSADGKSISISVKTSTGTSISLSVSKEEIKEELPAVPANGGAINKPTPTM